MSHDAPSVAVSSAPHLLTYGPFGLAVIDELAGRLGEEEIEAARNTAGAICMLREVRHCPSLERSEPT
jgi:hypothetical protein